MFQNSRIRRTVSSSIEKHLLQYDLRASLLRPCARLSCSVTNLVSWFPSKEIWQPSVYIFAHLPFCVFLRNPGRELSLGVCNPVFMMFIRKEKVLKICLFLFQRENGIINSQKPKKSRSFKFLIIQAYVN